MSCSRAQQRYLNQVIGLLLALYPLLVFSSTGDAAGKDRIQAQTSRLVAEGGLEIQGVPVASLLVLPALYEQRSYARVWTNPRSVQQLLDELRRIDRDGLDAQDYHLATLEALQAQIDASKTPDPFLLADFDLLLTDSLVRVGYHLSIGKVNPVELDNNWNMDRKLDGLDSVLALSGAIDNGTVDNLLASLRPQHSAYRHLQDALVRYREKAARGGWNAVPEGPTLKPGMSDERVIALRQRLVATGELADADSQSPLFDEVLETAVKTFQANHGLMSDGMVGKGTIAALNVTAEQRIDQIRVNLERARWVLHDLPDEFVLVDIAGFNVRYVRGGQPIWQSRAQVGRPYRKTPVFKSQITYLEMNPTWTVPPTILRNDILPAIKRDIGYLKEKNMRVLDFSGNTVDPTTIDWSKYSGPDLPYLIRQDPGPHNALGRIKFMFPNKHLVYLHDTPSKSLFERTERAFSSGCIRIENPYEFAELLLDDTPTWNQAAIQQAIDSRETKSVSLPRPVTVILLYWTVAADNHSEAMFKQDIYDRDPPILAALNKPFSFRHSPIFTGQNEGRK